MYKLAFIALVLSASAFANESPQQRLERSQQRIHDIQVGYCAAYHMMLGHNDAAREVQKLAVDKTQMAASGNALAKLYQRSPDNKQAALMVGRNACQQINFRWSENTARTMANPPHVDFP